MTLFSRWILLVIGLMLSSCATERIPEDIQRTFPEAFSIIVKNDLDAAREDVAVFLDVKALKRKVGVFNPRACVVLCDGVELPSQLVEDLDMKIVVSADFSPEEKKRVTLCYRQAGEETRDYPKRTQAELSVKVGGRFVNRVYRGGAFQNVSFLRVPPEHTDHSFYVRYEGPGWESDKVGYRFYLDWRNAIDIYGKKTPDMVLQNVGQDGFESYHEMSDWGMDVLKVGDALGIGSLGMWVDGKAERVSVTDSVTCRIAADGPVVSKIQTSYYGWLVGDGAFDVVSDLVICAGSRITWHGVEVTGDPENLCTGLVKHENTTVLQSDSDTGWSYLALWGEQSLAGDDLGIVVFYRFEDLVEVTEDELNYAVVLRPEDGRVTYGFAAAWEQEPDGIRTKEAFVDYLENTIESLNSPLNVRY